MKYVYMLRAGQQHYKVGVATNVKKRIASIQTGNASKVELVTARLVDDAYTFESEIHLHLQDARATGGQEWFILSDKQAIDLAIKLSESPEIDISQNIRLRDILTSQADSQRRIESKLDKVIDVAITRLERRQAAEEQRQLDRIREQEILTRNRTELVDDSEIIKLAIDVVRTANKASTSLLQRKLKIGYGRAARVIEQLEEQGIISEADGSRPRKVIG